MRGGMKVRTVLFGALLACVLLAGFTTEASATTYDMSGEWAYELTCACSPTLPGTALITHMELTSGEYSGTTLLDGEIPGTFSGTVTGSELSLSLVLPHTPEGELTFTMADGTLETSTNEFSGTGVYNSVGNPSGEIKAKLLRTLKQIEEKEEKEKFEREGREKGEKEGRSIGEKEGREKGEKKGMEKGELEGREKGAVEGKAKAETEVKQKSEQEAKERQAEEAQAKTEREAKEKAEKEAAEKADIQAREKVEREAREKVEKEAKERKLAEEKKRKKKPKHRPKHKSGKRAKAARTRGAVAGARP
jgi:hypothetical protein